jgi:hypothetical protein
MALLDRGSEDASLALANARIIAAAPDLLAVAESFLNGTGHTDACTGVRQVAVENGQMDTLFEPGGPCTKHCRRLRDVVAKALGAEVQP